MKNTNEYFVIELGSQTLVFKSKQQAEKEAERLRTIYNSKIKVKVYEQLNFEAYLQEKRKNTIAFLGERK